MTPSETRAMPESILLQTKNVRALMITNHHNDGMLDRLSSLFSSFEQLGINALILEVDYHFEFKSYPNLQHPAEKISLIGAQKVAKRAKKHGIEIIPLFHILGNQSKGDVKSPLLSTFPEFDTTPAHFGRSAGIRVREWDPLNERIERIIFALLEELIDAFSASALHIGMGEIFLLGHEHSPSTRKKNPAVLLAYTINVYRQFLIYSLNVSVFMFADRLIDGAVHDFGPWESSFVGTAEAIDLIPRDIIICPWHYESRLDYPSIPEFIQRGFRILPTCWHDIEATIAFINYCLSSADGHLLGFMFSAINVKTDDIPDYKPLLKGLSIIEEAKKNSGT